MNLMEQTAAHPFRVLMVFAALILFGGISLFQLRLEELPELPLPVVKVVADLPGYPPAEIEQLLTIPLENALSGIQGVTRMEGLSKNGTAAVTLQFDWDIVLENVTLEVRECVDEIYPFLPEGVRKPVVFTDSLSDRPVLRLVCIPREGAPWEDLYFALKYDLTGRLKEVPQAGKISIAGLQKPELLVETDMTGLYAMNLTLDDLAGYLGQFLIDLPAGKIRDVRRERLVQISSGIQDPEGIGSLRITPGSSVKFEDISHIRYAPEEATSLFLYRDSRAIRIDIYKNGSAGTLQAALAVKELIPGINRSNQNLYTLEILEDASSGITDSIKSLSVSLVLGLLSAGGVLFLLYRNWRFSLITSLAIPVCMVLLFFPMFLMGLSLNTISLLGILIGIGMIADNTIIVLEELSASADRTPGGQGKILRRITPAVVSSSLTTILVFIPPLLIPGVSSVLFRDLIYTITLLILLSLITGLFWSPGLFNSLGKVSPGPLKESPGAGKVKKLYAAGLFHLLRKCRRRKGAVLAVYGGIVLLLIPLLYSMSLVLAPDEPSGHVRIRQIMPGDWTSEEIRKQAGTLIRLMDEEFHPSAISARAGYDRESVRQRAEKDSFLNIVNYSIGFSTTRTPEDIAEIRSFLIGRGYDRIQVEKETGTLESALSSPSKPLELPLMPILRFYPRRDEMAAASLTAADLQNTLGAAIRGIPAGEVPYGMEKIPVRLRAREEYRSRESDMEDLRIRSSGGFIPLRELGFLQKTYEPASFVRINRGQGEMDRATLEAGSFIWLYLFALVLMFFVLAIQSGSLKKALILMSCFPLSLLGSLAALKICSFSLNLYGFIGILIMQGTVVNTGILILDSSGKGSLSTLLAVSIRRFRPVWATVLTTVVALLPVLVQSLIQGEPAGAMAATVIGGMLTGTPLILFFIPLFYVSGRAKDRGV